MARKCIWCNERGGELREITVTVPNRLGLDPHEEVVHVHAAHEPRARAFLARLTRNATRFLIGIALVVVLMPVAVATGLLLGDTAETGARLVAAAFAGLLLGLAVWLWVFPFATPETVRWLGIRKSMVAVRAGAVIVVALALWLVWIGIW